MQSLATEVPSPPPFIAKRAKRILASWRDKKTPRLMILNMATQTLNDDI
jgi:hypothetical protein